MTKPLSSGERVQIEMERYRGPQKQPRPQHISKPSVPPKPKQNSKAPRGK